MLFKEEMSVRVLFSILKENCLCGRDTITIKSNKYYVKEAIGEGGFSTVYVVENANTKRLYALKKIICHSMEDQETVLNEIKCHKLVNHENVIQLIDYDIQGTPDPVINMTSEVYLLLPYYGRGTLHHELERRADLRNPFQPSEILNMFLKICSGVKAFHQLDPPMAHRDLKTANILLTANDTPILMDLGSAAIARVTINSTADAQNLQDLAAERCSMPYRAPELFNVENHSMVDERTDIWSLGCILYAMCFYKSPFDIIYEKGDSVALAVLSGRITFPGTHIFGQVIEDLIMLMLNVTPTQRPFIDDVIQNVENALKHYSSSA